MKGRILSLFLILTLIFTCLVSCSDVREFTHCELTLVLDKSFEEEESDDFDLLLTNGDVAVSLIRITFEAGFNQGISDTYTAKGFAAFFMNKSGKSEEIYEYGDVPYYTYTETSGDREIFYTVTFYRSFNAYFIVAYATGAKYKDGYPEQFLEYALNAYFNDAPDIKTE